MTMHLFESDLGQLEGDKDHNWGKGQLPPPPSCSDAPVRQDQDFQRLDLKKLEPVPLLYKIVLAGRVGRNKQFFAGRGPEKVSPCASLVYTRTELVNVLVLHNVLVITDVK